MKKKLIVQWQDGSFSLALCDKSGILKSQVFFLRESPEEILKERIRAFLGKQAACEALVVLGRQQVILKELAFSSHGNAKENLENSLAVILPAYKEMAYGRLAAPGAGAKERGLLYAIPEKKVKEITVFLERLGLMADEVVSEDQCLLWLFQESANSGPLLVIDKCQDRQLFIVVHEKEMLFSGAYAPEYDDFQSIFEDISLSLLPRNIKPVKTILCGVNDIQGREIGGYFQAPTENFLPGTFSPVLLGAARHGQGPLASLLPAAQKVSKWVKKQKTLLRNSSAAFLLFTASFGLVLTAHLAFLNAKESKLARQNHKLAPEALKIKEMARTLQKIEEARSSKQRPLDLLKELAQNSSPSISFREFQSDEGTVVIRGESSSNLVLNQTVEMIERTPFLKDARLEHTRSRKRLNQDFFEFEITAGWKEPS